EEAELVEKKEEYKTEPEIYLDKLFKTFGLMTYYDLSQHDPYLFLIILSASMKLNTIESIKRIDITSKEFLETFLNLGKTIDFNTTTSNHLTKSQDFNEQKKLLCSHTLDLMINYYNKLSKLEKR